MEDQMLTKLPTVACLCQRRLDCFRPEVVAIWVTTPIATEIYHCTGYSLPLCERLLSGKVVQIGRNLQYKLLNLPIGRELDLISVRWEE